MTDTTDPAERIAAIVTAGEAAAESGAAVAAADDISQAADDDDTPPLAPDDDAPPRAKARKQRPGSSALLDLTDAAELWHDANRNAFATIPVGDHLEHWPVRGRDFSIWLAGQFYTRTGGALSRQALDDAARVLEARAINDGPVHETFTRVGRAGDRLYLDLCDDAWRAVEIAPDGWQVVSAPAVKLLRTPAMRALPDPEAGEGIEALRAFANVRGDDDFMLIVAWLVASLRDRGPYPILAVNGEQGTGKSFFCRMLRSLVDPSAAPIRATPKDDRDLIVSAGNSHVLAFDNLSSVPGWLSDALCRLATGGGFSTRMLHTDRDEIIFEAQKPILLNGIPALTDRADLADRALTIHLAPIPEDARRPEDELQADFIARAPAILGALCDAVSGALRHLPRVRLARSPRMADFVKWITAAAPGLGWNADDFARAYSDNRRDVSEAAFEADPVAVAIRDHANAVHPGALWSGTPTELLAALNARVPDSIRKSRLWPLTPQGLGGRIDRAAPLLRQKGFAISRRHSGVRTITIIPPGAATDAGAHALPPPPASPDGAELAL